jgi:hypothetical protein
MGFGTGPGTMMIADDETPARDDTLNSNHHQYASQSSSASSTAWKVSPSAC